MNSSNFFDSIIEVTKKGSKKMKVQRRQQGQKKLNPEFIEVVSAVVQGMMDRKEFQVFEPTEKKVRKTAQKRQQKQGVVFVAEPFYMKNGGEQISMFTQGMERNVPVELKIIKVIGDKAITLERFRARMGQYIQVRKLIEHNGKKVLGLREIENQDVSTADQAKAVIARLISSIS